MIQLKLRINESRKSFVRYYISPDGDLYISNSDFELAVEDWNNDGDIYPIIGMRVKNVSDNRYDFIFKDQFDLKQISESEFTDKLYSELNGYFMDGTDRNGNYYFCDSTDGGRDHFGDYRFMRGGKIIYGTPEDRENMIRQEIEFAKNI